MIASNRSVLASIEKAKSYFRLFNTLVQISKSIVFLLFSHLYFSSSSLLFRLSPFAFLTILHHHHFRQHRPLRITERCNSSSLSTRLAFKKKSPQRPTTASRTSWAGTGLNQYTVQRAIHELTKDSRIRGLVHCPGGSHCTKSDLILPLVQNHCISLWPSCLRDGVPCRLGSCAI